MRLCIIYEQKNEDEMILYNLAKERFENALLVPMNDLYIFNEKLFYRNVSISDFDAVLFRVNNILMLYTFLKYINGYTTVCDEGLLLLLNRPLLFSALKSAEIPIPNHYYCSVNVAKKYLKLVKLPIAIRFKHNVIIAKSEKEAKTAIDAASTVCKFIDIEEYSQPYYKVILLNKKFIFAKKNGKIKSISKSLKKICEKIAEIIKTDFCMVELNKEKEVIDVHLSPPLKSLTQTTEIHEALISHIYNASEAKKKHFLEKLVEYLKR